VPCGAACGTKTALAALGIFGASLFLGDSMITRAMSVLSAVEGLKVAEPSLEHLIVPITAAIIVVADHRRCRRVLRPAARQDGDHGVAHRGVTPLWA
jgi:hypothetical protein